MKKILVVNVNWIGDVIFSSAVFRALKEQSPEAQVSCLCVPRVAEVAGHIPSIDEVIIYDEKGRHRFPIAKARLIRRLRREKFDAAFLLHGSWTRALLVFLSGIPLRVGHARKGRGIFLTHHVKDAQALEHRADHYLRVVESFGIPVRDRGTHLAVDQKAAAEVRDMLSAQGLKAHERYVVLHPGGNWDLKRWPKENFAKLANLLAKELSLAIVVCGSANEKGLAQEIAGLCEHYPMVMAGQTNFAQLAALMAGASVVISGDSGPLHVASSVGTAVVGLFGPTHPDVTGPRGPGRAAILRQEVGCNHRPCYHLKCMDNICMKAISANDVVKKAREIIA